MSDHPAPDRAVPFDDDNPEWTEADFARARRGDAIPAHIRAAFAKTNGTRGFAIRYDAIEIAG
jgi:hypothetical protein